MFRCVCECVSLCIRWIDVVHKMKNAQIAFLDAPLRGEGRASTQGWRALLAISSSPLVPHGPADRRGVGIRSVSGVGCTDTFYMIYFENIKVSTLKLKSLFSHFYFKKCLFH